MTAIALSAILLSSGLLVLASSGSASAASSPTASFVVTKLGSTTSISTAQENQTLVFNANATFDPDTPFDQLAFAWWFGDGSHASGNYVTHTYLAIRMYTIWLNVTDPTSNYANISKTLTITSMPRPDLRVTGISFDPLQFTAGEPGRIVVEIANVGGSTAEAPTVEFYLQLQSGQKTFIGNGTDLDVNGTASTQLLPGQHGMVSITWTPIAKGNYTIFVNAVAVGEINKDDNTNTATVTCANSGVPVIPAALSSMILVAAVVLGVALVVAAVVVLVVIRRK